MTYDTREQIARDSKTITYNSNPVKLASAAMIHQHKISFAAGRNAAIEEAIVRLRAIQTLSVSTVNSVHNNAIFEAIKEIESLKNENEVKS